MWEEDKEIRERRLCSARHQFSTCAAVFQPTTGLPIFFWVNCIGAIIIVQVQSYVITIRLFGTTPLQFSLYRAHAIFYS